MTHAELVHLSKRWLARRCPVVITEMSSSCHEQPDAIGWRKSTSYIVEAKTSRSDFKADSKKYFRQESALGMGNFRYFITPKGLLRIDELPDGWGLLEAVSATRVREVHPPGRFMKCSKNNEINVTLSALRRMVLSEPLRTIACRTYTYEGSKACRATVGVIE